MFILAPLIYHHLLTNHLIIFYNKFLSGLENGRPIGRLCLGPFRPLGKKIASRGALKGPLGPWVEIVRLGVHGRAIRTLG